MSKLKAIVERFVNKGEIIEDSKSSLPNGVLCRVRYPICRVDALNRNKRIYNWEVWDRVAQDDDILEKLRTRTMFCQEEHPEEGSATKTSRISGVVTELVQDRKGNIMNAIFEVLDTPYGRIIDTLLKAKCGIGVSTRAEGELEEMDEDGETHYRVVPDKYKLITVDFTADPSTLGAYPENVERAVASEVKKGLESQTMDRKYAVAILESMKCKDAKSILEDLKKVSEQVKGEYQKDVDGLVELLKKGEINHEDYVKKLEAIEQKYRHAEPPKAEEKVEEMKLGLAKATVTRLGKKKDLSNKEKALLKKAQEFISSAPKEDLEAWNELDKITESAEELYDIIKKDLNIGALKVKEDIQIVGSTPYSVTILINDKKYEYEVGEEIIDKFKRMLEHGAKFNALHWLHKQVPASHRYKLENGVRVPLEKSAPVTASVKENVKRFDFETLFKEMKDVADVATLDDEDKKALKESKTNVDFFKNTIALLKKIREGSAISKAEREIIEQNAEKRINDLEDEYAKDILEFNNKIADLAKQLKDSKISGVDAQKQIAEKTVQEVKKIYEHKMDELRAAFEKEKDKLIESHKDELFQKSVVDISVRESGLELPEKAIAVLRHCKTKEEVENKISDFRFQLKEAVLHSGGQFEVKVEETIESGVGSNEMVNTTKKLIKGLGRA